MTAWPQLMETLIRERGRALHGYAYVLTGSHADAEDLVQDALVKVFSRVRGVKTASGAEAYVRQTMRTLFIDDRRRHRHRREVQGLAVDAPTASHAAQVETTSALHGALLALPPRERICVVMRFMEDLAFAQIAGQLGIGEATARRYAHDGVARLGKSAVAFGITPDLADNDSYSITVYAHRET